MLELETSCGEFGYRAALHHALFDRRRRQRAAHFRRGAFADAGRLGPRPGRSWRCSQQLCASAGRCRAMIERAQRGAPLRQGPLLRAPARVRARYDRRCTAGASRRRSRCGRAWNAPRRWPACRADHAGGLLATSPAATAPATTATCGPGGGRGTCAPPSRPIGSDAAVGWRYRDSAGQWRPGRARGTGAALPRPAGHARPRQPRRPVIDTTRTIPGDRPP